MYARLIVFTAPSGTGKTTLSRRLVTHCSGKLVKTTSVTTRNPRPNEIQGDHYTFVSQEEFDRLLDQDQFLEWAWIFQARYGTSAKEVEDYQKQGKSVLLEIDVKGWDQVKKKTASCLSIFLLPPSAEKLWERLESRGTEALEVRLKRFTTAYQELEFVSEFDHIIINDDLETAFDELSSLVSQGLAPRLLRQEGLAHAARLREEMMYVLKRRV